MKTEKTIVSTIQCPSCNDVIFSRSRHDYRPCSCGSVAIDGGFDYVRISSKVGIPKVIQKTVNVNKTDLYKDWNYQFDKYGIIKPLTSKKKIGKVKTVEE